MAKKWGRRLVIKLFLVEVCPVALSVLVLSGDFLYTIDMCWVFDSSGAGPVGVKRGIGMHVLKT